MKAYEVKKEEIIKEDYEKVKILKDFFIVFDGDVINFEKDKIYAVRKDVLRHIDYIGLIGNVSFDLKNDVKEKTTKKEEK